jgi:TPR repeat protein
MAASEVRAWRTRLLLLVGLLALTLFGAAAGQFEDAAAAYTNGDYATALREFRSLADHGQAVAQYNLGRMYYDGRGAPQDFVEAAKWFRLAADQGHAGAENNLGAMYVAGQGLQQSTGEALRWYRLAADQGYAIAQHNLGSLHITGRYLPQDFAEGAKWFRRAADQGYAPSMLGLAALYEDGDGVPRDYLLGYMWYNLAIGHFASSETDQRDTVVEFRDELAAKMTRNQIAEAQRLAREWVPK